MAGSQKRGETVFKLLQISLQNECSAVPNVRKDPQHLVLLLLEDAWVVEERHCSKVLKSGHVSAPLLV
jgi:hypothetical protein